MKRQIEVIMPATRFRNPYPEPVAILGFGVEGRDTLEHLKKEGVRHIVIFDRNATNLAAIKDNPIPVVSEFVLETRTGTEYLADLPKMATVFRSAGIRPDLPELLLAKSHGAYITSQIEEAFAIVGPERILGVTGTLGKGTCCTLLESILNAAGIPCLLAGNIGRPALDAARALPTNAWLILELSSFQLSTLGVSPRYAAVLRTTVEHLDWHPHQKEYWQHKANLVAHQNPQSKVVYCQDVDGSRWVASQTKGEAVGFGQAPDDQGRLPTIAIQDEGIFFGPWNQHIALSDTNLHWPFMLENLAAAGVLALWVGASFEAIRDAAAHFPGLEHRVERVAEFAGITYYNDSYATRPEATIGAVKALGALGKKPLGLILGGSEKHADFTEMATVLNLVPQLKAIALIGHTALRLQSDLQAFGVFPRIAHKHCAGLAEAEVFLRQQLQGFPAASILLSPACASFGLFENYKERGKAFKKLVASLPIKNPEAGEEAN